ncbi:hypothetical protein SAMN02910456_02223 [Ruminococcaceae bacterium YRB3002]|nr:hypothetical protein SAMN02910456_02223 [Ruminococcaceae bacterium YRB3002]
MDIWSWFQSVNTNENYVFHRFFRFLVYNANNVLKEKLKKIHHRKSNSGNHNPGYKAYDSEIITEGLDS